MLLFATGFALGGLALLIIAVQKVVKKTPPSQNIPPANQPPSYMQPQPPQLPSYNWSLNSSRVQKLALGQGSGRGTDAPQPKDASLGIEDGEFGLVPIACSSIQAKIPVFQPEPVHRAERVYEEPPSAPLPNSVAIPVEEAPDPNAVATPAAYFREQPAIQDIPTRKIKKLSNRADHVTAVAVPMNPDGEIQNFFRNPEPDAADVIEIQTPETAVPCSVEHRDPPQTLDLEEAGVVELAAQEVNGDAESEEMPPIPCKQLNPEQIIKSDSIIDSAPDFEPVSEPDQILDSVPVPKPEPKLELEPEPKSKPASNAAAEPKPGSSNKRTGAGKSTQTRKKKKKKARSQQKKARPRQKKAPPIPTGLPAERVVPAGEGKTDSKKDSERTEKKSDKAGLKNKAAGFLREYTEKLTKMVPKSACDAARPILCCACVAVCLLCLSLFFYFDKNPVVDESPIIVDIPRETQMPEFPDESKPDLPDDTRSEPVSNEESPKYMMAVIGEQEAVSAAAEGFEPSFESDDYTDVPFYALSFAIQLDSDPGEEYQKIQVFDSTTMEDLTSTANSILHVYTGAIPSNDYFMTHPVKSAPVVSSAVSEEIITCVFVSLEKRTIHDLKVILSQASSGTDTLMEHEIVVNSPIEDLILTPTYPMGNGLLKLGEQYYVVEAGTGIGSVPDENKYVTRKLRCVSLPLTGSVSGLDASSTALFDRQTGEKRELPAGTSMYYKEEYKESEALMEIAFGIQLCDGSYDEATDFLDNSFPGYIIGDHAILF